MNELSKKIGQRGESGLLAPGLKLFFLLDTSSSMEGEPIGSLNRLMNNIVNKLKSIDAANDSFRIQIAVMEYNSDAEWITKEGPTEIDQYLHPTLAARGTTYLGNALEKLDQALSSGKNGGWMERDRQANYMPIFVCITDGLPMGNWEEKLEDLKKNIWFRSKNSVKMGFLLNLGNDEYAPRQRAALEKLVGDNVLTLDDLDEFEKQVEAKVISSTILQATSTRPVRAGGIGDDPIDPDPGIDNDLEAIFGLGGVTDNPDHMTDE